MPEVDKVRYDADTSNPGPYFIDGDVIEHPGGRPGLWLVYRTKISPTTHLGEAILHQIAFPSDEQRAAAQWWNPLTLAWAPTRRRQDDCGLRYEIRIMAPSNDGREARDAGGRGVSPYNAGQGVQGRPRN